MENENLRLEALKIVERILQNRYDNALYSHQNTRGVEYPNTPTIDEIIGLAEKLTEFIFQ